MHSGSVASANLLMSPALADKNHGCRHLHSRSWCRGAFVMLFCAIATFLSEVLCILRLGNRKLEYGTHYWVISLTHTMVHPKAMAQTMMRTLRKIKGTALRVSVFVSLHALMGSFSVLLISVRTELIRLIILYLTLVLSCIPPKDCSCCDADPHPTVLLVSGAP